ncbi:MAG: chemotaxis protein CheD [Alphaproteobacteria bacterium]|nr:chemotaxis protein CheD [Alphaproteobacteria bacterium]MCD8520327.1 chemotaxis protein CheD [Alphaproteobacteria bacterium]MCD8571699.1 chemotaxis protein CheD [Alphaproteobacteria bacterium]
MNSQASDLPDRRLNKDSDAYFNAQFGVKPLAIKPGHYAGSGRIDEMIIATVESGILLTMHDKDLKIGGMAYIALPDALLEAFPYFDRVPVETLRRALLPVDECIRDLKRHGAGKNRIRLRLIGGTKDEDDTRDTGTKTFVFVKEYITRQGLRIMSEDIGGKFVRRVHYFPYTGRTVRKILRREEDFKSVRIDEKDYRRSFTTS